MNRKWKKTKIFTVFLCFFLILLSGCAEEKSISDEEKTVCWGQSDHMILEEDGCYFLNEEEMLYYFDISSGKTVPVCDKAECEHQFQDITAAEEDLCNAQMRSTNFSIYGDKIYYVSGGEYNELFIRCRDLDGNNDKKVTQIEGVDMNGDAMFYQNKLLITVVIYASKSFDAETKESDSNFLRLYLVDLDTGDTKIIDESSCIDQNSYGIMKGEKGKFYYYDMEENAFFTCEAETGETELFCNMYEVDYGEETADAINYYIFHGDYCYGIIAMDGIRKYVRLNIETGEGEIFLVTTEPDVCEPDEYVTIPYTSSDAYYTLNDWENPENNKFAVYDFSDGSLTDLPGKFFKDFRYTPAVWTDMGAVFLYAVDWEGSDMSYSGDFEYRYISRKDLMEGNDNFQTFYYLDQGE